MTYQRDGSHPSTLQGAITYKLAAQGKVSFATGAIISSTETDPVLWASLLMETTGMLSFLHRRAVSKFPC